MRDVKELAKEIDEYTLESSIRHEVKYTAADRGMSARVMGRLADI